MRFRTKTILGVALIEMVLLAILVMSTLSVLRDSNQTGLMSRAKLASDLLAAAAKDAVISQDLATLDSLVKETIASGQVDVVRILDARGVVLAERGETALLTRPWHQESRISQATDGIYDQSSPVSISGISYGEVRIGVSTAPLRILIDSARRWAAGIAGIEMLLVALFSWLLGSYLLRQLVELRMASQRVAAGKFETRVHISGNDELAETAVAFNHMAAKIGESHEQLRAENMMRRNAQKAAELSQAEAEEKSAQLSLIFSLSPDGFVSFDSKKHIEYVNPAFLRMTSLLESDVIGLNEAEFSACLARLCVAEAMFVGIPSMRAMHKINAITERRQQIELAGPSMRVLDVTLRESDSVSVPQVLYLHDITHETETERLKSEFLATAAHELRTPMASIYGYSELLLAQDFSIAEMREHLGTIFQNSELMVLILNELLDLSRIEARRGRDFSIAAVDLVQLLQDMTTMFKTPPDRRPPEVSESGPLSVRADREKLTQALSNLLSNAYKYSPDGGDIRIDLLPPESDSKTNLVGIRISDHGIGMTPEQLERVFERFYRADSSGQVLGAGLGMSIVKEIVKLHQGEIEIQSQLGAGTTVTLWIPGYTL